MLEALKEKVYEANMELARRGLVLYTWGNVSGIDRERGLFVIKPSGVPFAALRPEDMVVMNVSGEKVAGKLKPSSDTKTHLALYHAFAEIGGVAHTHSACATAWAQSGEDLPCFGTTHADYFYGAVPCARGLTRTEIDEAYEANTGKVIAETFAQRKINPAFVPAVLCRNHGPFAWGASAGEAAEHAAVLEEAAKMALFTKQINPDAAPAPQNILEKHFLRKHGRNAYYGQTLE
jgi:L-ribulose-5-phosphate 4-epimerase